MKRGNGVWENYVKITKYTFWKCPYANTVPCTINITNDTFSIKYWCYSSLIGAIKISLWPSFISCFIVFSNSSNEVVLSKVVFWAYVNNCFLQITHLLDNFISYIIINIIKIISVSIRLYKEITHIYIYVYIGILEYEIGKWEV